MNIEELKKLQEDIIKKNRICNIVGFLIFLLEIPISIFTFLHSNRDIFITSFVTIFEIVLLIVIITAMKNKLNGQNIKIFYKEFKNTFVYNSLKKCFENLTYSSDEGFSENAIDSIGMIDTGDRFSSNDYISGTYKNIKFEQSDIHIEEEREEEDKDGNKSTYWVTIFKGRWMIFDFNKDFRANIQVVSQHFYANYLVGRKKYSKVKMEDTEFNKMFRVNAENEHEAFYILTPHFMERVKKLKTKLNCSMMLCFVDNKLHIAINNNEDSFEYNVFKRIDEEKMINTITNDIKLITDFVDELNLDNDLFKEEK